MFFLVFLLVCTLGFNKLVFFSGIGRLFAHLWVFVMFWCFLLVLMVVDGFHGF